METKKFEMWCLVELMGHQKIAGLCTEQVIAGSNMLRVDVPLSCPNPPFTRFYSSSAVYAIHPIDEQTAKRMASSFNVMPITQWDIQELIKNKTLSLPIGQEDNDPGF